MVDDRDDGLGEGREVEPCSDIEEGGAARGERRDEEVGAKRRFTPPDFEDVYSTHLSFLWRSLRLLGVKDHLLEDACQDVATVIFRRLPEFEGRSSLRTWLYGIAQGVAANHRRRVVRKEARLVGTEDLPAGIDLPAPPRDLALEAAESIIRFSDTLVGADLDLFVAGLVEQIPAVELAGTLGLGVVDVRRRLSDLRETFRRFVMDPSAAAASSESVKGSPVRGTPSSRSCSPPVIRTAFAGRSAPEE